MAPSSLAAALRVLSYWGVGTLQVWLPTPLTGSHTQARSVEQWCALDTPPPATLDEHDLLRALSRAWALWADELRYVPKGAGSYHWIADVLGCPMYFVTVDDLETKPWIGRRRNETFEGLSSAYEAAWVLQHEAGLALVVAALRRPNGSISLRLSGQYSMTVFPYIAGYSGTWGDSLSDSGRDALLHGLASLHQATPRVRVPIAHRPLDLPERPLLNAALAALDRPWDGGPFSEPARHALAGHVQDVALWLEQLDRLAHTLEEAGGEAVLTHGEPHPGNLMLTVEGLRLIDWDTVALARPERDLWMLDDGSIQGLGLYEDLTRRTISTTAIAFYRLVWTLSDIASFAAMFRSPHQETEWILQKWNGFQLLLQGAPSVPYGFRPR
jgi:spectinomycin phosphotransferase